jgi:predicted cupin superfamily sugar epimerase
MNTPEEIISRLHLQPLPVEGGYYSETYRSTISLPDNKHCCGTSIYYLLHGNNRSDWHQVASDEIWFYHCGSPAVQLLLFPDGHWEERVIGNDIANGQVPQSVIPAGVWQAATLLDAGSWGLFGAVVFPGFEYFDFTAGDVTELITQYPSASERIRQLDLAERKSI